MSRWQKYGSTSSLTQNFLYFYQLTFQFIPKFVYKILALLKVLEYKIWQNNKFGKIKNYMDRKKLLLAIITNLNNSKLSSSKINIYEFGVAFGELTNFMLENINVVYNYHGFDTFNGLPYGWRGLPKGAISSKNKVPEIFGEGIKFHTGLIKDTASNVDFKSENINLFIFDFDLYEPTLFTYNYVHKNIKKGDILFFDEAFTQDERIIIENYFFRDFTYKVIGSSPFAIAFEVVEPSFTLPAAS
jgi:hypothetical protein